MTIDYTVTRCEPVFTASRDSPTGWRVIEDWAETEVEMIIIPRGEAGFRTPVGYHGQITDLGMAADPVAEFNHIVWGSRRYEVKYIKVIKDGDNFIRRDIALVELPLFQEMPQTATWKTGPDDARSKVKDYLDLRVTASNLTKNDGSTQISYAVIFENPPYHLRHEYRASSSPVQGLYVVGSPATETLLGASTSPLGYEEHVPIHVATMDSTGCGGEQLRWKMNAELRNVVETYQIGSNTNLLRQRDQTINLGSDPLYDTTWDLSYRRSTT